MTSLTAPAEGPVAHCDVHQNILELQRILRRVAGMSVDVRYQLYATAVHVALADFELKQILVHLIGNARDAMPAGGMLSIATRNHRATAPDSPRPARSRLELAVADSGCGVHPHHRRRIFEPFFTTKRHRGHAGLGLAIVERLVQRADGHIEVDGVMGLGTTFRVVLPVVG